MYGFWYYSAFNNMRGRNLWRINLFIPEKLLCCLIHRFNKYRMRYGQFIVLAEYRHNTIIL